MDFWRKHTDAEQPLKTWYGLVKKAKWRNPSEIKNIFGTADFLDNGRVCFNIKGNKYRLIAKINYESQRVYIRFIGTHADYDKINANIV